MTSSAVILIAALAFVAFFMVAERRLRLKATFDRSALSSEQIYATYFEPAGYAKDDVLQLWREIVATLEAPEGFIRPEDRLGKDIGGGYLLTPELDTLSELAADRAEQRGLTIDLQRIETVRDYVQAFARHTRG